MIGIAPELLTRHHELAALGMRENSAEEPARAREGLLAAYLGCHALTGRLDPTLDESHVIRGKPWMARTKALHEIGWGDEDQRGFEWIDRLAENGHAGARQLRTRVLDNPAVATAIALRKPERMSALAAEVPAACVAMARYELAKTVPDLESVCRWLQALQDLVAREIDRRLAWDDVRGALPVLELVREMRRIAGEPDADDIEYLRELLSPREVERNGWRNADLGGSLQRLAVRKLAQSREEIKAAGERLLERAADLGSSEAQDAILARSTDPKTVCRWLHGARARPVAEAADLLRELAGGAAAADLKIFHATRSDRRNGALEAFGREPYAARLLYVLAAWRLEAANESVQDQGWRLLEHAAERGSRRAQLALFRRTPDVAALARRIEAGGEPGVAAALQAFFSLAGQPGPAEAEILAALAYGEGASEAGQLLHALAQPRLLDAEPAQRELGRRLVKHAAQLGSADAKMAVVIWAFEEAGDRRAFGRTFLGKYPNSGPIGERLCLLLGRMAEDGELGGVADLAEAADWYAKGLGRPAYRFGEAGAADGDFCYAVAVAFDRRWRIHSIDDPARAMAWHARALAAGNVFSFNAWLEGFLKGDMGIAQDPDEALVHLRRFKDVAGHALKDALMQLGSQFRLRAGKLAETDAALAVGWYRIAAELGSGDAHFRIGCLYLKGGSGLARDVAVARDWFDKGAALDDLDCKLARIAEGAVAMGLVPGPVPPTPEDDLDAGMRLALAERLLARGERERALHLLNWVIEHGTAPERERAARLTNPRGSGPLFGSGLDSLEIV